MLLTLTAGGLGLNLVGANHLLLLDPHWNPQLQLQVADRVYRMGQTKPVSVYKFIAADTIEKKVEAIQDRKQNLTQLILAGSKVSKSTITIGELQEIFRF